MLNWSNQAVKPYRELFVNGVKIKFLCDSGADTTTLNKEVPGMWPSSGYMYVKSANGLINRRQLSSNVEIVDPTTNLTAQLPVLFAKDCPVGLLGRDCMEKLKISLVPVTGGMQSKGPKEDVPHQLLVQEGWGEPRYYWTLDILNTPPQRTAQALLDQCPMKPGVDVMKPDELHITLKYKATPGPDHGFDKQVQRLGNQQITLKTMYQTNEGATGVSVIVSSKVMDLVHDRTLHVSLTKLPDQGWTDVERIVRQGESMAGTWTNESDG